MGYDPEARLAYGYDLGTDEDPHVAQRGEYGGFEVDWTTDDDGFADNATHQLLAVVAGFTETDWQADGYFDRKKAAENALGVELLYSGSFDYPGFVLAAAGSKRSVEWSDTMTLDLDAMADETRRCEWDAKLAAAVAALGLTPNQDRPGWLVFPFYG